MVSRMLPGLFLPLALAGLLLAEDWPQWRGPARDGVWREEGIVEEFAGDRLEPLWTAEIGPGYSGPTVAAGRVYVTDRLTDPRQVERVHCFDSKSGKPLWSHTYDCRYRDVSYEAGPRASVTVDQGRAYALGTMGDLFCFAADTGAVLWRRDLNTDYGIHMPIWGISASPLVYGDLVIVQIGGEKGACIVALNKKDGTDVWKALDDRASYAAPILVKQAGRDVLICWTGDNLAALAPLTGEVHWREPFTPTRMVIGIATPVVEGNRIFVTSFYDGAMMVEMDPNKLTATKTWRRLGANERNTDALHSIIATPLFLGDNVYGVDSYGELRCLNAANGDRIWEDVTATPKARWSNIHMVRHGEQVWMFNERGELLITRLSPEGFTEIDRAKLIEPTTEQLRQRGGVCWAHPAFADRCIFVRNDKQLVCASLAKE